MYVVYTCMCVHAYVFVSVCVHTHVRARAHTHTNTHTHSRGRTHTCNVATVFDLFVHFLAKVIEQECRLSIHLSVCGGERESARAREREREGKRARERERARARARKIYICTRKIYICIECVCVCVCIVCVSVWQNTAHTDTGNQGNCMAQGVSRQVCCGWRVDIHIQLARCIPHNIRLCMHSKMHKRTRAQDLDGEGRAGGVVILDGPVLDSTAPRS